jgi:hypothetical protein
MAFQSFETKAAAFINTVELGDLTDGSLDIAGGISLTSDIQLNPSAISTAHINTAGSLRVRCTDGLWIGDNDADSVKIGRTNTALAPVYIRSGGDNDLVVKGSKVGVGTDSPDETLHLKSSEQYKPELLIENTNDDQFSGVLRFYKSTTDEAASDQTGLIIWTAKDGAGADANTAWIVGKMLSPDAGAEEGSMHLGVASGGSASYSTLSLVGSGTEHQSYFLIGDPPQSASSTKTGINTSVPAKLLDINARGSADGIQLTWDDADGSAADYATITIEDTNGKLKIATVDGDGAAGHIALIPDGNVGIGVESPSAALEIDGDIKLSPTAISTAHVTSSGSLTIRADANMLIGDSTVDSIKIGRTNTAVVPVHLRSGGDNDLVVKGSKVGINDDSPSHTLDVDGDINLTGGFSFDDGTAVTSIDTDISSVSGSDDTLASAKSIKTYVDSVATASDLDFQGDSGGALSIDLDSETLTIAGTSNEIETVGSGNTLTIGLPNDVTVGSDLTVTDSLVVDTSTLVVNASGYTDRVGVGTATPAKNLHVYGASGEVELRIQSDTSYTSIVQKDNNELIIQNAASGGVMIFHDDAAERMRIDTDGKVGIGNTAPGSLLEVSKVSGQASLELSSWSATATSAHAGVVKFQKSGTATVNTFTAGDHTTAGEILGRVEAYGVNDGDASTLSSYIEFANDAVSDADSSPGKIVFATSDADDAGTPTVRLTIDDDGLSTFTGDVDIAGELKVADTSASDKRLSIKSTDTATMSADRDLVFDVRNANRSILLGGDVSIAGDFTRSGAHACTLTTTGTTSITLPTTGTVDNTTDARKGRLVARTTASGTSLANSSSAALLDSVSIAADTVSSGDRIRINTQMKVTATSTPTFSGAMYISDANPASDLAAAISAGSRIMTWPSSGTWTLSATANGGAYGSADVFIETAGASPVMSWSAQGLGSAGTAATGAGFGFDAATVPTDATWYVFTVGQFGTAHASNTATSFGLSVAHSAA